LNLASEPSVARQDEPFDAGSLKACSGGDDAAEASFLDALLRTNLSDLIELQALARSGAFRDAAACAHRIKGAAGIVKAGQVVRGCEEIEAAFKSGDREEVAAAVQRLSAALQQLNEAISAQLRSYAVPAP
jgi:two-component system sensor histidine kinase EvgS